MLVAALSLWSFGTCADPVYNPVDGMVPDEATAIRIAEAVWIPLYGEEQVLLEEPYMGTLEGNVWKVESVSPHAISLGTYSAQISKLDGRILSLSHGK